MLKYVDVRLMCSFVLYFVLVCFVLRNSYRLLIGLVVVTGLYGDRVS